MEKYVESLMSCVSALKSTVADLEGTLKQWPTATPSTPATEEADTPPTTCNDGDVAPCGDKPCCECAENDDELVAPCGRDCPCCECGDDDDDDTPCGGTPCCEEDDEDETLSDIVEAVATLLVPGVIVSGLSVTKDADGSITLCIERMGTPATN